MVRIRDNNILTFDASVNGQVRRNIPKEKGISHTGADETLIYNNGRASLYLRLGNQWDVEPLSTAGSRAVIRLRCAAMSSRPRRIT